MTNICIRGARTHNLSNIDIELPRNQLIVVTGLSGSGKSSLVFDTLYAEGQRRYVESLSAYARQFLSVMDKPDVDAIEGLSPAIAIEQKSSSHNPRSTVGTVTEIYDYLRVLFARIGEAYCITHHISLAAQTISQMTDSLLALPTGIRIMLMAPVVRNQKGEHTQILLELQRQGYVRVRIDGQLLELDPLPRLTRNQKHTIDVVIDRLKLHANLRIRLAESLAIATQLSNGLVTIVMVDDPSKEQVLSARFACPQCDYSLPELEPRLFSFNNPTGACPSCDGLGLQAVPPSEILATDAEWSQNVSNQPCPACAGTRLRREARCVLVAGHSLPELTDWSIATLYEFFNQLSLSGQKGAIAGRLQQEIQNRLGFLVNVGLDYLNLARRADSLSGGEAQRIRLASQIGSGLVGVMYILDEPSIGLHPRDNTRLLKTLYRLRDLGNTVIIVEHDEEAIRQADYVVDIGPGAGVAGGRVVAHGPPAAILQHPESLTGQYLSRRRQILVPAQRRPFAHARVLRLEQATGHNLQQINVELPLGLLTCITGVSGSGKSTLINDTIYPIAANQLNGARLKTATYGNIIGLKQLDKVIEIDQSPIGRTPRSNPATYSGLLTIIRELFAATPEARSRGYTPARFSFNVKGGRCEACEGSGTLKVEMHFLADVYVPCEVCRGQRYNRETLEIFYKGKTIAQVLAMSVAEAYPFFAAVPSLARIFQTLFEVGLGYLSIGQNATHLSGGEAQRLKLARELTKRDTGKTLYLLDEPTTGLHFYDIEQLLKLLHRLCDQGNTVVVIEHNLDVIKTADWIIDLGPEGGSRGGRIVCCGTPEMLAQHPSSYTGQFLKSVLTQGKSS